MKKLIALLVMLPLFVGCTVHVGEHEPTESPTPTVSESETPTVNMFDETLEQVWNQTSASDRADLCLLGPEFAAQAVWKNLDSLSRSLGSFEQVQTFFAEKC